MYQIAEITWVQASFVKHIVLGKAQSKSGLCLLDVRLCQTPLDTVKKDLADSVLKSGCRTPKYLAVVRYQHLGFVVRANHFKRTNFLEFLDFFLLVDVIKMNMRPACTLPTTQGSSHSGASCPIEQEKYLVRSTVHTDYSFHV